MDWGWRGCRQFLRSSLMFSSILSHLLLSAGNTIPSSWSSWSSMGWRSTSSILRLEAILSRKWRLCSTRKVLGCWERKLLRVLKLALEIKARVCQAKGLISKVYRELFPVFRTERCKCDGPGGCQLCYMEHGICLASAYLVVIVQSASILMQGYLAKQCFLGHSCLSKFTNHLNPLPWLSLGRASITSHSTPPPSWTSHTHFCPSVFRDSP